MKTEVHRRITKQEISGKIESEDIVGLISAEIKVIRIYKQSEENSGLKNWSGLKCKPQGRKCKPEKYRSEMGGSSLGGLESY